MLSILFAASLALAAPDAGSIPRRACVVAPAPLADSMTIRNAELKAAIDSGIAMLRTKHYDAFLRRFVSPADIDEVTTSAGGFAMLAEAFKIEKARPLLRVLEAVRKKTPSYDEAGTVATFKLPKSSKHSGVIEFTRIEGLWYIVN